MSMLGPLRFRNRAGPIALVAVATSLAYAAPIRLQAQLDAPIAALGTAPEITDDVAYGPSPAHRLKVFRPVTAATLPAVLWVHGGGWFFGNRHDVDRSFLELAERGEAVLISIDYRLVGLDAGFPAPVRDAKRALYWVKQNAALLGVDPDRVVIAGSSAGGTIAAAVGVSVANGRWAPEDHIRSDDGVSYRPAAVVNISGVSDFHTWRHLPGGDVMTAHYLRCGAAGACDPLRLLDASPVAWVDASVPPALHIYGEHDDLVPGAVQGLPLAAAWAAARGARGGSAYEVVAGQGHVLDLRGYAPLQRFLADVFAGRLPG